MEKQPIYIEKELASNAENVIWSIISSAHGLEKWIADTVEETEEGFRFIWGNIHSHHEVREARVLRIVKNKAVRLQWTDDTEPNEYWELRMSKSELTNDYILGITDYALPEDLDSMNDIWEDNFARLHRHTGL